MNTYDISTYYLASRRGLSSDSIFSGWPFRRPPGEKFEVRRLPWDRRVSGVSTAQGHNRILCIYIYIHNIYIYIYIIYIYIYVYTYTHTHDIYIYTHNE